jgi:hypothetical protein
VLANKFVEKVSIAQNWRNTPSVRHGVSSRSKGASQMLCILSSESSVGVTVTWGRGWWVVQLCTHYLGTVPTIQQGGSSRGRTTINPRSVNNRTARLGDNKNQSWEGGFRKRFPCYIE